MLRTIKRSLMLESYGMTQYFKVQVLFSIRNTPRMMDLSSRLKTRPHPSCSRDFLPLMLIQIWKSVFSLRVLKTSTRDLLETATLLLLTLHSDPTRIDLLQQPSLRLSTKQECLLPTCSFSESQQSWWLMTKWSWNRPVGEKNTRFSRSRLMMETVGWTCMRSHGRNWMEIMSRLLEDHQMRFGLLRTRLPLNTIELKRENMLETLIKYLN